MRTRTFVLMVAVFVVLVSVVVATHRPGSGMRSWIAAIHGH
jgi:hypothetical protein